MDDQGLFASGAIHVIHLLVFTAPKRLLGQGQRDLFDPSPLAHVPVALKALQC